VGSSAVRADTRRVGCCGDLGVHKAGPMLRRPGLPCGSCYSSDCSIARSLQSPPWRLPQGYWGLRRFGLTQGGWDAAATWASTRQVRCCGDRACHVGAAIAATAASPDRCSRRHGGSHKASGSSTVRADTRRVGCCGDLGLHKEGGMLRRPRRPQGRSDAAATGLAMWELL